MKLVLIIAGILVGLALLGFIALQLFFVLAKRWEDKDVI
jgi:hypothetical protein